MGSKHAAKARVKTRKIIGRLTYSPEKHKQKFTKTLRDRLASRLHVQDPKPPEIVPEMVFGSMNVNGLDQEAHWAVSQLLSQHSIDVSSQVYCMQVDIPSWGCTGPSPTQTGTGTLFNFIQDLLHKID